MFLDYTSEQVALRDRIRATMTRLMTAELRAEIHATEGGGPLYLTAMAELGREGWLGIGWPKAYGGQEQGPIEQFIFFDEVQRSGFPIPILTLNTVGPTLLKFGSEEQKATYPPAILRGECHFSIGYTEPASGTDLASLSTRARREGDKFIINGQKIWTTGGHHADYMFALVRTNPDAADRREGISMILIDLKSKGIRRRPIRTLTGEAEFAEIFFDDVEVPADNIVLGVDQGWMLANTVLEAERMMSSSPQKVIVMLDRVLRVARATGACDEPPFRDRLAVAYIDALAFQAMFTAVLAAVRGGERAGPRASILKIANAELLQTLADLMLEASGSLGMGVEPLVAGERKVSVGLAYLQARRQTIYGGTSEIMRELIGRSI
jgi:alkylation response protein AidB-like acyl-CoA dehydrogenase